MGTKKRIAWITVPSFLSTDRFIVPIMSEKYSIDWYIISRDNEQIDFENEIMDICSTKNINLLVERIHHRSISIHTIFEYNEILNRIKAEKYDLVYCIMIGIPYFMPLLRRKIGKNHVLVGIHNVHVPKGGSMYLPSKIYTNYTIHRFKYFQTFSESQKMALLQKSPKKYCEYVHFVLLDYGKPKIEKKNDLITFLSFGIIREYKRVDIIIQAAQKTFELTNVPFKVVIAGSCDEWEKYQKLIKYPELFELIIRRIENDEIPDLFAGCHYFLTPYQDIAQSGAAVVAVNYNLPIISSKLEAFMTYIKDGETGFLIEPANCDDLVNRMIYVLENHEKIYSELVNNISFMKEDKFSEKAIAGAYTEHFEYVSSR